MAEAKETERYCKKCKKELDALLSFQCHHCKNYFCVDCRLPEMHNCPNLKTGWDIWRRRQKKLQGIRIEPNPPQYPPSINIIPEKELIKTKEKMSPEPLKTQTEDNSEKNEGLFNGAVVTDLPSVNQTSIRDRLLNRLHQN